MKSDLVDIPCRIVRETEKAYCIADGKTAKYKDGSTGELHEVELNIWIPKSMCEWNPDDKVLTMRERLAMEKGLI